MWRCSTNRQKKLYKIDYPNAFNLTYQSTKSNINKQNAKKKKSFQQKKSPAFYIKHNSLFCYYIYPKKHTKTIFALSLCWVKVFMREELVGVLRRWPIYIQMFSLVIKLQKHTCKVAGKEAVYTASRGGKQGRRDFISGWISENFSSLEQLLGLSLSLKPTHSHSLSQTVSLSLSLSNPLSQS